MGRRWCDWDAWVCAWGAWAAGLLTPVALALVAALTRALPAPPVPPPGPTPEQRATARASEAAAGLWNRYRDPAGDAGLSAAGRRAAIVLAAVLDDDEIHALAGHIHAEHLSEVEHPPLSHKVTL